MSYNIYLNYNVLYLNIVNVILDFKLIMLIMENIDKLFGYWVFLSGKSQVHG
jgi:hypothetical protein